MRNQAIRASHLRTREEAWDEEKDKKEKRSRNNHRKEGTRWRKLEDDDEEKKGEKKKKKNWSHCICTRGTGKRFPPTTGNEQFYLSAASIPPELIVGKGSDKNVGPPQKKKSYVKKKLHSPSPRIYFPGPDKEWKLAETTIIFGKIKEPDKVGCGKFTRAKGFTWTSEGELKVKRERWGKVSLVSKMNIET